MAISRFPSDRTGVNFIGGVRTFYYRYRPIHKMRAVSAHITGFFHSTYHAYTTEVVVDGYRYRLGLRYSTFHQFYDELVALDSGFSFAFPPKGSLFFSPKPEDRQAQLEAFLQAALAHYEALGAPEDVAALVEGLLQVPEHLTRAASKDKAQGGADGAADDDDDSQTTSDESVPDDEHVVMAAGVERAADEGEADEGELKPAVEDEGGKEERVGVETPENAVETPQATVETVETASEAAAEAVETAEAVEKTKAAVETVEETVEAAVELAEEAVETVAEKIEETHDEAVEATQAAVETAQVSVEATGAAVQEAAEAVAEEVEDRVNESPSEPAVEFVAEPVVGEVAVVPVVEDVQADEETPEEEEREEEQVEEREEEQEEPVVESVSSPVIESPAVEEAPVVEERPAIEEPTSDTATTAEASSEEDEDGSQPPAFVLPCDVTVEEIESEDASLASVAAEPKKVEVRPAEPEATATEPTLVIDPQNVDKPPRDLPVGRPSFLWGLVELLRPASLLHLLRSRPFQPTNLLLLCVALVMPLVFSRG